MRLLSIIRCTPWLALLACPPGAWAQEAPGDEAGAGDTLDPPVVPGEPLPLPPGWIPLEATVDFGSALDTAPQSASPLNAQMHLRGEETSLGLVPTVESLSLVLGVLGFTLGMEQRLNYSRVRACTAGG